MEASDDSGSRPVMDASMEATPEEKIRGLLDQVAADVHRYPGIDPEAVVRQWIKDREWNRLMIRSRQSSLVSVGADCISPPTWTRGAKPPA
jgi:hypothetical protein